MPYGIPFVSKLQNITTALEKGQSTTITATALKSTVLKSTALKSTILKSTALKSTALVLTVLPRYCCSRVPRGARGRAQDYYFCANAQCAHVSNYDVIKLDTDEVGAILQQCSIEWACTTLEGADRMVLRLEECQDCLTTMLNNAVATTPSSIEVNNFSWSCILS